VLSEGRVVEEGTHDELIALSGEYRRLYNLQLRMTGGEWTRQERRKRLLSPFSGADQENLLCHHRLYALCSLRFTSPDERSMWYKTFRKKFVVWLGPWLAYWVVRSSVGRCGLNISIRKSQILHRKKDSCDWRLLARTTSHDAVMYRITGRKLSFLVSLTATAR